MPGFIHRLFGRDDLQEKTKLDGGVKYYLWDKGSPDSWYFHSKSSGLSKKKSRFQKWWGRSLFAHIGVELIVYLVLYYIIHAIVKLCLTDEQSSEFEAIVDFFNRNVTPLSKDLTFLLGFYVSQIVKRWWSQYSSLPNPDSLALLCHGLVDFSSPEGLNWAKKLMRYVMLSYVLCLRRISKALMGIGKRAGQGMFPDNQSLIEAGLATRKELAQIESQLTEGQNLGQLWWIPLSWTMTMIKGSKEAKIVPSDQKILIDAINKFQAGLEKVDSHDHIVTPPLYGQVVRFAVYVYFTLSLIASQEVSRDPYTFVPIFLILKFVFFVGWLEVAESIENPFGNDDDDFQIPELISRHVWAISRNFNQFRGPPDSEEDEKEVEEEKKHVVTLQMDLHKKT